MQIKIFEPNKICFLYVLDYHIILTRSFEYRHLLVNLDANENGTYLLHLTYSLYSKFSLGEIFRQVYSL